LYRISLQSHRQAACAGLRQQVEGRQSQCEGAGPGAVSRCSGMAQYQHRDSRADAMKVWLLAGLALASLNQASEAQPVGDTVARVRACMRYENTARQECFDALWEELTRDHLAPATPPGRTGEIPWVVSATMSPLDYSPQVTATKVARSASGNAPSQL